MTEIRLQGVGFCYVVPGTAPVWALREINLTIPSGQFVLLAGATGSGKSTLVQHLNGLLFPTVGQVVVGDVTITGKGPLVPRAVRGKVLKQLRQKVGVSFQYPEHQLFASTVAEDVAFGPRALGEAPAVVEKRVAAALEWMGVSELAARSPFHLSGGQRRRVALAGVLAMQPAVLVLDEPTAGLDPNGRNQLLQALRNWQAASGGTLIVVSHQVEELAPYVDRLLVLSEGRVVADGPPRVVLGLAELAAWGLESPELSLVLQTLRESGWTVPKVALTVEEAAAVIREASQR